MKRFREFTIPSLTCFWFSAAAILGNFAHPQIGQNPLPKSPNQVFVGVAKYEITPPLGTPLSGYGRRRGKPSRGIGDPVYVKALSLSRGNQSFIFIGLDFTLIDSYFRSEVLRKINEQVRIDERQVILFATHTHSGPGAVGKKFWQKFIMGRFDKSLFNFVTDTTAKAAIEAASEKILVSVYFGEKRIDELIRNRMDPELAMPSWLRALQFEKNGQVVARFVSMAAHPTILSSSNFAFSGDYPGKFMTLLESDSPRSVTLFANGAAGDLSPKFQEKDSEFDSMEGFARSLYSEYQTISWKQIGLNGPWICGLKEMELPPVKLRLGKIKFPSLIGDTIFPKKSLLHVVRLGEFVFPAIPGELGSEVGFEIEDQIRAINLQPIIIGYANDYLGYVIPHRHYKNRKFYEARASFYGKKMDWYIQEQIENQLLTLLTKEEKAQLNPPGTLSYNNKLPVLKLSGLPYHRGFEEGRLLKEEINEIYAQIYRYFRSHLPIPGLNQFLINKFLDRTWKKLEPHVSYSELRQLQGLSDGAEIPLKYVLRIHSIPEVLPTGCSNGAYWGPATSTGRLIAIRNLDWNRDIGVQKAAAVKFHRMSGQFSYANIGYLGFIGVLSGLNEAGISVGQIGATSSDEAMDGAPMPFLLKRVLTRADTVNRAVEIFEQSRLTQGFNYIIADATGKTGVVIEATHNNLAVFSDNDPKEHEVEYSLPIPNAIFRGDPAMDPTIRELQYASSGDPDKPGLEFPEGDAFTIRYLKHGNLINQFYGQIDPKTAKEMAGEISPSSNIQSVVYAFPDFWVANAEGDLRATDSYYHYFSFFNLQN